MDIETTFILSSNVKSTTSFLVENKLGNGYSINQDKNKVKIIGTFTIRTNSGESRRKFESKTLDVKDVTEGLVETYKNVWTNYLREKMSLVVNNLSAREAAPSNVP